MLAYYVTAHGYGHGARSADIMGALDPDLPLTVVSDLPKKFFADRLPGRRFQHRPGRFDVGMVQVDSVRVDVEATLQRLEGLLAGADRLVEQEAAWLDRAGVRLVVGDIPALPFEAATRAGIPAVAAGNFGWDWIYSAFAQRDARWRPVIERFRQGYSGTDLLLRFPFAEPMATFPHHQEIGLVARPGRRRDLPGVDPEATLVLLSFTTLELSPEAVAAMSRLPGYQFVTVLPLRWDAPNFFTVDPAAIPFADLVASVDVVLSKPGFGILSDTIVNSKPLIYVERTDFLEYPILEAAVKRYLRHCHLPAEALYRGDVLPSLEAIAAAREPADRLPHDGARVAAARLRQAYSAPVV